MISFYSSREGLGGVSILNEKGETTVSQLLIKDAHKLDEVSKSLNDLRVDKILEGAVGVQ